MRAVLSNDNRTKLKNWLVTSKNKNKVMFEDPSKNPKFRLYAVAINEIKPNPSGTEAKGVDKRRDIPQFVVTPLTDHKDDMKTFQNAVYGNTVNRMFNADTIREFMEILKVGDHETESSSEEEELGQEESSVGDEDLTTEGQSSEEED